MRRIQHGDWFIQSEKGQVSRWIAWASQDRLTSPFDPSVGEVYFDFGATEIEAVNKVTAAIDSLKVTT